jgi:hypothetical protein
MWVGGRTGKKRTRATHVLSAHYIRLKAIRMCYTSDNNELKGFETFLKTQYQLSPNNHKSVVRCIQKLINGEGLCRAHEKTPTFMVGQPIGPIETLDVRLLQKLAEEWVPISDDKSNGWRHKHQLGYLAKYSKYLKRQRLEIDERPKADKEDLDKEEKEDKKDKKDKEDQEVDLVDLDLDHLEESLERVTRVEEAKNHQDYLKVMQTLEASGDELARADVVYIRRIPSLCHMFDGNVTNASFWKVTDDLFSNMTDAEYKHPKWQGLQNYYKKKATGFGYVKIASGGVRGAALDHALAQYANPFWHPRFFVVSPSAVNLLWGAKSPKQRVGMGTDRAAMREIIDDMRTIREIMKKQEFDRRIYRALEEERPLQNPPALR